MRKPRENTRFIRVGPPFYGIIFFVIFVHKKISSKITSWAEGPENKNVSTVESKVERMSSFSSGLVCLRAGGAC